MPHHILLVEDHPHIRDIFSTVLRLNGYTVTEAGDGQEGLELARTLLPDLILMDISIPVIDGWTAIEYLKKNPLTSSIPILAVTAHALPRDRQRAEELGCIGYIPKPSTPTVILQEVRRVLGEETVRSS